MCVEAIGMSLEGYDAEENNQVLSTSWNGRTISFTQELEPIAHLALNCARNVMGHIDHYVNTKHDVCPRGHETHYIYYQWPARPIFLCDEQYDSILHGPCPFEYYSFLRHLNGG